MAIGHTGSWGLPDFGISEKIGSLFKTPQQMNNSGGSNVFGQYQVTPQEQGTIDYVNQTSSNGKIPYAPGQNMTRIGSNPSGGTPPPSGGSGQVLGASDNGGQTGGGVNYAELDAIYNPVNQYLDQYAGSIQGQQPQVEQNINANYGISRQNLEGQKTSGLNQLGQQETEAGQSKESADSNAVRLFNELKRGGIQRFGGASSAGHAFGELTANELQRNLGTIQKTWAGTVEKINSYKVDLENKFSTALQTLDQQKVEALQNAQQFFQDKMLEVTRMKAENQSAKATAQLGLLQDLRNKVYAINMQDLQYKQQLAANKQQSEASVSTYAQQMIDNLTGGDKSLQAGLLGMSGATNSNLGIQGGQQSQTSTPTGQVTQTNKKWDPATGTWV